MSGIARLQTAHDLDQCHYRDRVEEMHADGDRWETVAASFVIDTGEVLEATITGLIKRLICFRSFASPQTPSPPDNHVGRHERVVT
jgi:hypothetical protein